MVTNNLVLQLNGRLKYVSENILVEEKAVQEQSLGSYVISTASLQFGLSLVRRSCFDLRWSAREKVRSDFFTLFVSADKMFINIFYLPALHCNHTKLVENCQKVFLNFYCHH